MRSLYWPEKAEKEKYIHDILLTLKVTLIVSGEKSKQTIAI